MLYDNALLIDIYSKAYQRYPKRLYEQVVAETITWLKREMPAANGAYYAALDADTEGHEGATYLWSPGEVVEILGKEEGEAFCKTYGITEEGNFENSGLSNPALLSADAGVRDAFADARIRLLAHRDKRPQPARDEKCIVSWNALLIGSLARAGFVFGHKEWLEMAVGIAEWVWNQMRDTDRSLAGIVYGERVKRQGNIDDYAYSAEAFMDLASIVDWLQPGDSLKWIERSRELLEIVDEKFADPDGLGYYFVSRDQEQMVHRKKDWYDNATPAGNSCLIHAHASLYAVTGNSRSAEILGQMETAYPGIMNTAPAAASHALSGLVYRAIGQAVIKVRPGIDLEKIRLNLVEKPYRPVFIMEADEGSLIKSYQLCVGTQCLPPTDDLHEVIEKL
jgi:uncharacterized protein YyaL (SSP411 family)